jgi:hypothetical protein
MTALEQIRDELRALVGDDERFANVLAGLEVVTNGACPWLEVELSTELAHALDAEGALQRSTPARIAVYAISEYVARKRRERMAARVGAPS